MLREHTSPTMLEKSFQEGFKKMCFLVRKSAILLVGLRLNFLRKQTLTQIAHQQLL